MYFTVDFLHVVCRFNTILSLVTITLSFDDCFPRFGCNDSVTVLTFVFFYSHAFFSTTFSNCVSNWRRCLSQWVANRSVSSLEHSIQSKSLHNLSPILQTFTPFEGNKSQFFSFLLSVSVFMHLVIQMHLVLCTGIHELIG